MSETQLIKVTQEKLPGSQVGLEIEVPPDRTQKAYDQVLTKAMRTAQIPGFRKGKVPRQVILKRFGVEQLKASALEDLIQKTLETAIKQEQIEALGNLQLRTSGEDLVAQYQPGQPLTFSASVDVLPEVQLEHYQAMQVEVEKAQYNPQQVDQALEEQQVAEATLVPVEDRPAQKHDEVLIDLHGEFAPEGDTQDDSSAESEGQTIEGSDVTDFKLDLSGRSQFLPGLVEGIIGMAIDETKSIPLTFPQDYLQEDLAGKAAIFTVTLKDIKAKEIPDLDDDFAQAVSEFDTLAELREFLEKQYQQQAQDTTDANIEAALVAALLEKAEVEPPESLVKKETEYLIQESAARLQSQGVDVKQLINQDTLPQLQERMRPDALLRVQRTLALAEVAQKESIKVDSEVLEQRFQKVVTELNDRKVDKARLRIFLEEDLLKEAAIQWLRDHAQIKFVEAKAAEASVEAVPAKATDQATTEPSAAAAVVDTTALTVVEAATDPAAAAVEIADVTPEVTTDILQKDASEAVVSDQPVATSEASPQAKTKSPSKTKTAKAAAKAKTANTKSKDKSDPPKVPSKTAPKAKTTKTAPQAKTKSSSDNSAPKTPEGN